MIKEPPLSCESGGTLSLLARVVLTCRSSIILCLDCRALCRPAAARNVVLRQLANPPDHFSNTRRQWSRYLLHFRMSQLGLNATIYIEKLIDSKVFILSMPYLWLYHSSYLDQISCITHIKSHLCQRLCNANFRFAITRRANSGSPAF